jgi:hypothetical protein
MKSGSQSVYSPPRVVRIGDLMEGTGANCASSGSSATTNCTSNGTGASGGYCRQGDSATPGDCSRGNNPGSGSYCTAGDVTTLCTGCTAGTGF